MQREKTWKQLRLNRGGVHCHEAERKRQFHFANKLIACIPLFVALSMLVIRISSAVSAEFQLTVGRVDKTKKPNFQLNGEPIYLLIYADHYSKFTPQLLEKLHSKGINAVQVAIDTEDTRLGQFRAVLTQCEMSRMPVIVELQEWTLRDILMRQRELNMVMSDNRPVEYFPDFSNPEARREHLGRYSRAADNIVAFARRPIVAVSVGAYDAYHLPDGEVHHDFVVPAHTEKRQTRLPYGRHTNVAFAAFLNAANAGRPFIGAVSNSDGIRLPTTPADAVNEEHWRQWLLFRRQLVASWLEDTVNAVRKRAAVPVGVSFDLNFARRERFATPPYGWTRMLDFVSVYCYGRQSDAKYMPGLMRTVWREFSDAGVPMIGFLEFSSALSGATSGESYAREAAPFVSGLMTTGPVPGQKHGPERIDAFIHWAVKRGSRELLQMVPQGTEMLVVLNKDHPEQDEKAVVISESQHRVCDVLYVDRNWSGAGCKHYRHVVLDHGLSLLKPDSIDPGTQVNSVDELAGLLAK